MCLRRPYSSNCSTKYFVRTCPKTAFCLCLFYVVILNGVKDLCISSLLSHTARQAASTTRQYRLNELLRIGRHKGIAVCERNDDIHLLRHNMQFTIGASRTTAVAIGAIAENVEAKAISRSSVRLIGR